MIYNYNIMHNFINPVAFILSFLIGICYTWFIIPAKHIVIKYPTLDNQDKIKYVDDAGMCYTYTLAETTCPPTNIDIMKVPVQEREAKPPNIFNNFKLVKLYNYFMTK